MNQTANSDVPSGTTYRGLQIKLPTEVEHEQAVLVVLLTEDLVLVDLGHSDVVGGTEHEMALGLV